MSGPIADWTRGAEAIVYQTCNACGARQYFRRSFCAACGSPDLAEHRASRNSRDGWFRISQGQNERLNEPVRTQDQAEFGSLLPLIVYGSYRQ